MKISTFRDLSSQKLHRLHQNTFTGLRNVRKL